MSEADTMPWVEKYRPKNLNEISSQSNTTTILERSIKSANLPHLLFYGPPGTGKTSTILALAHQLYGPKLIKSRVLELNASDERGISIVRDRIKNFARLTVSNPTDEDLKKYPCPPYKLIILDEADSMTTDAQSALRRTMETYANVTRFCLICNYVTRIIDPLASRCSKFRFKSLEESEGLKRLNYIAKMEHIKIDENISKDLINVCEGDLRRAINLLQCIGTVLSNDEADNNDQKNSESVKELFGFLSDEKLNSLLQILMNHNFNNIINFIEDEILYQGYSASILLTSLHDKLLLSNEGLSLSLDNNQKNQISLLLFKTDSKLVNGGSDKIQLLNCLLHLSKIL